MSARFDIEESNTVRNKGIKSWSAFELPSTDLYFPNRYRPVEEQELPFDPTVNYLTPGDMKREGEVKLPHLTEGDMVFERQLFGSGLYQLFIRFVIWSNDGCINDFFFF